MGNYTLAGYTIRDKLVPPSLYFKPNIGGGSNNYNNCDLENVLQGNELKKESTEKQIY